MKDVLLLGHNGQLGTEFQHTQMFKDGRVIIDDSFRFNATDSYEKFRDYFLTLITPETKYVINCIAANDVNNIELLDSFYYNAQIINETLPTYLAIFCFECNLTMFHFSTDYVYETTAIVNPLNRYGYTKLFGEKNVKQFLTNHFIFRVSSLFGRKGNNFLEKILQLAKNGEVKIKAGNICSPTSAWDLAKAVEYFIDNEIRDYGTYNVCNRYQGAIKGINSFAFAYGYIKHIDNDVYCFPENVKRPKYVELSDTSFEKLYKMSYLHEAIIEYIDNRTSYLEENHDNI